MFRTRAAALHALAIAASGAAACHGGPTAYRAGSGSAPAAYESAPTPAAESMAETVVEGDRPGLGTEFGESIDSRVVDVPFERASAEPFALVAVHYNDAEGIEAQARSRGGSLAPITASTPHGGLTVALTDEGGEPLPGFAAPGRAYVVGQVGQRYNIQVTNHTGGRYEVVASVDGLDVVDGRTAGTHKRGYIVAPHSTLTIDGFRTSQSTAAAFRFSSVRDSYASRTGDDRNVGVVGFAFFAEIGSAWTDDEVHRRENADPFPDRYASPPP